VLTTGSERSHSVDRRIRVILEHIFVHLKPDIFPRGGGRLGNDLNLNATTESTVPTSVHIFRDILLRFRFSRYDTRDGQRADDGRTDVGDQSMHIWPKAGHHCKKTGKLVARKIC